MSDRTENQKQQHGKGKRAEKSEQKTKRRFPAPTLKREARLPEVTFGTNIFE